MILVWYSKVSSCSLCSLRFCRAQLLKQRLQKQPCNKFGLKATKRSVKKLQKSTPALIVRPGIYGLGKAVNPGDVFSGCGFCDFTFLLKIPPTPFLWIQNNAANFPLPRDRHIRDIFPLIRPGFLPLGQAKLRSGHRGIERRGQDLRLGPGLGAREERGSSSAPLRVSLASKAPFPFPFKCLPRRLADDRCIIPRLRTSMLSLVLSKILSKILRPVLSLFLEFSRVLFFKFQTFLRHQFRNAFLLLHKRANINED